MNMTKEDLIKDEYSTKDLYLAAFLQVKGMFIKKLEQRSGRGSQDSIYFIFEDKKKCTEFETVFWNGVGDEILVNAKNYFTTIRDLKSRIFSIKKVVDEKERLLR
jgi:hypothetical protein